MRGQWQQRGSFSQRVQLEGRGIRNQAVGTSAGVVILSIGSDWKQRFDVGDTVENIGFAVIATCSLDTDPASVVSFAQSWQEFIPIDNPVSDRSFRSGVI